MPKKNISDLERIIRIAGGIIILAFGLLGAKTPWAYIGLIPLVTGIIGWCPPYALSGFSTCKRCGDE